MEPGRRSFLKASAGAAAGLILSRGAEFGDVAEAAPSEADRAMLVDVTKCISCWWCYAACKKYNNLPETTRPDPEKPPRLSPDVWTTLKPVKRGTEWHSSKLACSHCTDAVCVEVCPTGALSHNSMGFVQYDRDKCCGCGYCAEFCPFGVPQLGSESVAGVAVMDKCTFCRDRVTNGEQPACAEACPTGAIRFGERSELVQEGRERATILQQTNPNAMFYGDKELGGLHVVYVLDDSPEVYGLPADPQIPPAVTVRDLLKWVGVGAVALAVAGLGLNYLIARVRTARVEK